MPVMQLLEQHIPVKDIGFITVYFTIALLLAFLIVYVWNKVIQRADPNGRLDRLH